MANYDLTLQIKPGNRLDLTIPVPESTPPSHYADMLIENLSPVKLDVPEKESHNFTVYIDDREVAIVVAAESLEVARKIVCARCYNIIKTEAIRNT